MARKEFGDYYLGLDIGTDSVGWAVTDPEYNILKFNGKSMWGINLFDPGNTAEERRAHRCSRRRINRRKQRLNYLYDILGPEVEKIDPDFVHRMDESNLLVRDKNCPQPNSIFNDPAFKDADYHKKYPTIYHLRKDLVENPIKHDIRLIYLAIHHILKYRGHFLFQSSSQGDGFDFSEVFNNLTSILKEETGIDISINETLSDVQNVLSDRWMRITQKKEELTKLLIDGKPDSNEKEFVTLLSGGKGSASKLLGLNKEEAEEIKDYDKICFKDSDCDDKLELLGEALADQRIELFNLMKQVYDFGMLQAMLGKYHTISAAKVADYELHAKDLRTLKDLLKGNREVYKAVFKSNEPNNYCAYSGVYKKNPANRPKSCTQEAFCKYIKKVFQDNKIVPDDETYSRIEEGTFLPKQRIKDNSIIPNSLHTDELKMILKNASKFYPYFETPDKDGFTPAEKILSLSTFRIPYYVGPLSRKGSEYSWAEYKSQEPVRPWNFFDVVDKDKTSYQFINRLIGTCSQLRGEKVLPKCSVYYQRFMLYNEINTICINSKPIDIGLKKELVKDLFLNGTSVNISRKAIADYVSMKTGVKDVDVTGIDDKVKANLRTEREMKRVFSEMGKNRSLIEELVRDITIFGDDRSRLVEKLQADYGSILSKEQLNVLKKMKFADWGNLSKKLLLEIRSDVDGVEYNILGALENTQYNFMQLLSNRFGFSEKIAKENAKYSGVSNGKISHELVDDLYCSPTVKKGIWQVLKIIQDIRKVTGHAPKKIFVETTRSEGEKKRTVSRKDNLVKLYTSIKDPNGTSAELLRAIESTDEPRFRQHKLYMYYLQEGMCAYCGKHIDLNDLRNKSICDREHIYPQSKVKDDSIRNNMVLSCRDCNQEKSDAYPIKPEVQMRMKQIWARWRGNGLMSEEKYKRLTRSDEFSDKELEGFINRQLVETSQTVKAVTEVLSNVFGKDSDVVYVKAENVSRFRETYQDHDGYVKARNVNDYHHAKDAYLNIVVGNVYDVKFTKNPIHIIRAKETYSLRRMFDFDVSRGNVFGWKGGPEGTIRTIDKYMRRNDIHYVRAPKFSSGTLFNVQLVRKNENNRNKGVLSPKGSRDPNLYGGYNSINGYCCSLVEHTVNGKRVTSIETIMIKDCSRLSNPVALKQYYVEQGLVDPLVIRPCIMFGSIIEADGFRLSLTGRSGDYCICRCAEQLVLPYDLVRHCKRLYKFEEECKRIRGIANPVDYQISAEDNIRLFKCLRGKLDGKYGKIRTLRTQRKVLDKIAPLFETNSVSIQARILNEVLHLFQCNADLMDLSLLGGGKNCGDIRLPKTVSNMENVVLVSQSPSGMFENKVVLSK